MILKLSLEFFIFIKNDLAIRGLLLGKSAVEDHYRLIVLIQKYFNFIIDSILKKNLLKKMTLSNFNMGD